MLEMWNWMFYVVWPVIWYLYLAQLLVLSDADFLINTHCDNIDRLLVVTFFLEIDLKILHQFLSLVSATMIWLVPMSSMADHGREPKTCHIQVWRRGAAILYKIGIGGKPKTCHIRHVAPPYPSMASWSAIFHKIGHGGKPNTRHRYRPRHHTGRYLTTLACTEITRANLLSSESPILVLEIIVVRQFGPPNWWNGKLVPGIEGRQSI